jgi:hypothetical protein
LETEQSLCSEVVLMMFWLFAVVGEIEGAMLGGRCRETMNLPGEEWLLSEAFYREAKCA